MNTVRSAAETPKGHGVPLDTESPAAPCTGMFDPIQGLDPDFGPRKPTPREPGPWWSWLHRNKARS